ncbi:hypothetical protein BGX38DRAFT_307 [Terfezia claveryi]|nr:hypothetical protein BGX38DRAFT_307 [Terfezia claveryi]
MTSRPRSPYLVCRQFHFQGMPGRTIGTRPATLQDLDALAVLAQSAYERCEGGAGHGVYQFCWNKLQNPTVIYKDDLESVFKDENKQIYVLEDTSPPGHELLAAAIVVFQYDTEDGWETLGKSYGPEYARWTHYQNEISQMRRDIGTNRHVHIQDLIVNPQYSHIETRDPQNPEPFLAKALFHFIYSYPDQVKHASEITAIVPIIIASWLYRRLGFEEVPGEENRKRIHPPVGVTDSGSESGMTYVDVQLLVWRRRAYSP